MWRGHRSTARSNAGKRRGWQSRSPTLCRRHEKGILHRDLKPGNILVSKSGVKLLDFGLAKFVTPEERDTDATVTAPITGEQQIVGTVAYMSPEQVAGKALDARSDIFSVGLVLYEMLSGRRAFTGDSQIAVMHAIVNDAPPRLRDVRPGLPAAVETIVSRALQKETARRYQSAGEMKRDLSAAERI